MGLQPEIGQFAVIELGQLQVKAPTLQRAGQCITANPRHMPNKGGRAKWLEMGEDLLLECHGDALS